MNFRINHKTEYSYSDRVFFEPHYLRFKPKTTAYFTVEDFKLHIAPDPAGFSEQLDVENNHIFLCWFEETHNKLKIEADIFVNVREFNPFNFLIHPQEYEKLPFGYNKETRQLLKPSLQTTELPNPMIEFLQNVLKETDYQTVNFLTELTKQIHQNFLVESRETGTPFKPGYTFAKRKGSCRDLAWMQIHLLRSLGIASRFVSGYFYVQSNKPTYELHAWIEVYIPGAGWIGFDPSHGLITGSYHIPVASGSFYANTMPVSGTVRGDAKHSLKNELNITLIS